MLHGKSATTGDKRRNVPFQLEMPFYLSKHDIVYLSPPVRGYEGFPLGNGDVGGMIWCTATGLRMQINKSDLWDDKNADTPCKTLRSAAALEIDFGAPCLDWKYLEEFEGRLSLHQAETTFRVATPFMHVNVTSLIHAERNVWLINCKIAGQGELQGGAATRITLERWGSRAYSGWYSRYNRDATLGLGTAHVSTQDNDLVLEERFGTGNLIVACRVLGVDRSSQIVSKHRGEIRTSAQPELEFTLAVSVATSEEHADPLEEALNQLNSVSRSSFGVVQSEHRLWWESFWSRSFVHINHDYIENLYYFKRYIMASGSRGRYPLLFNGGLWLWNSDIRNWVAPHHWNMEESYWGLCAQNDSDLLLPYLEAYWRNLDAGIDFARERGADNAVLWSEAHDYHGNMPYRDRSDMLNNYTPASQIAGFFWEYYQYTGDRSFLREKAYPFMKLAAEFYLQKLEWDEEKEMFFIFPSQSYECPTSNQLRNPITDRVMVESLFRNCISASELLETDGEKREQWSHTLSHLWEPEIAAHREVGDVLVEAYTENGDIWWRHPDGGLNYHFSPQSAIVFPANIIGISDQTSPLFVAVENFINHHPPEKNAISPDPIVAARMGLGGKSEELLVNCIRRLQHFPQGFFYNIDHWYQYSLYSDQVKGADLVTQRDYIHDDRCSYETTGAPTAPFVQCGLEALGILGAAINEMLLQSYDGVIRVFPALPDSREAAFTLRAAGGFTVSASISADGIIPTVSITSDLGGECKIYNPWPGGELKVKEGASEDAEIPVKIEGGIASFETRAECNYSVYTVGRAIIQAVVFTGAPNTGPKSFHEATLGKARNF